MIDDLKHVTALVAPENDADEHQLRSVLGLAKLAAVRFVRRPDALLAEARALEPDLLIMGFALEGQPTIDTLRAIRRGETSVNPYSPVVIARSKASRKAVSLALNGGAHEFLALPTSVATLSRLLYRAIFAGRPFVNTPTYIGPCRRRRPDPAYEGPERRRAAWAGYVHASHDLGDGDPHMI